MIRMNFHHEEGNVMAAQLILTCDYEKVDTVGKHLCGFSQSFLYQSYGEAMSAMFDSGWRKQIDNSWHCPTCAAGDTDDV
jgi:hypothetical protein